MSLFTNGNARITRLIIIQLGLGTAYMVLTQIQGFLPNLDFLTPKQLKLASFVIATVLTAFRGGEMFFSKTTALLKDHKEPEPVTGDTAQFVNQNKP